MRGEIIGIFAVLGIGKAVGFGDVAKRFAAQDIAVRFCTHNVVAVVKTFYGECVEEGRIVGKSVVDIVTDVERVV